MPNGQPPFVRLGEIEGLHVINPNTFELFRRRGLRDAGVFRVLRQISRPATALGVVSLVFHCYVVTST